jgi:hypothetical protein
MLHWWNRSQRLVLSYGNLQTQNSSLADWVNVRISSSSDIHLLMYIHSANRHKRCDDVELICYLANDCHDLLIDKNTSSALSDSMEPPYTRPHFRRPSAMAFPKGYMDLLAGRRPGSFKHA